MAAAGLRNKWTMLLILLMVFMAAGCALTRYQVQVNGYTEGAAAAVFPPGAGFCVMTSKDAANLLLEQEIKTKIVHLLKKSGYRLAPFEKAEYYLFFTYGLGQARSLIVSVPEYGLAWGGGFGYESWPAPYTFYWPGFVTYAPYTYTVYDRWLLLNVVEGQNFRATGTQRPLWVGDVKSTGTSADLREVINPMLTAAFEQFGKNTGKAVMRKIAPHDPRLKELQQIQGIR